MRESTRVASLAFIGNRHYNGGRNRLSVKVIGDCTVMFYEGSSIVMVCKDNNLMIPLIDVPCKAVRERINGLLAVYNDEFKWGLGIPRVYVEAGKLYLRHYSVESKGKLMTTMIKDSCIACLASATGDLIELVNRSS